MQTSKEESEVKTISRDNAEKNLLAKIRYIAQVLDEKSDDAADYTAQASYSEITAELFRLVLSLLHRLLFIGFVLLALEMVMLVLILQHGGSPLV